MIVLPGEILKEKRKQKDTYTLLFCLLDNEVHSAIPVPGIKNTIPGSLLIKEAAGEFDIRQIGNDEDRVRVVISTGRSLEKPRPGGSG